MNKTKYMEDLENIALESNNVNFCQNTELVWNYW